MINSDNSIQSNIKFTFTVYEYILLSNFTYIYIYIYTYIKICVFCPLQHCRNPYAQSFPAGFTRRTVYPIVNMIQVINKEARAT